MKIQYLGTAAAEGWPAVFCACKACEAARTVGGKSIRTRSQAIIDNTLLLDFPPDSYMHMLQWNVPLSAIASVIVTHSHQDHFYPLDLILRGKPYAHKPLAPKLTVYGNDRVGALYEHAMLENDSPNIADVLAFTQICAFKPFTLAEGYTITPLLAKHNPQEKCLLYLVEKDGKTIFYANDSGLYPQETWAYLQDKHIDLVSFDCTCVSTAEGSNHMGIPDNKIAKKRLEDMGCTNSNTKFVITHFSHNGALMHEEIEKAVADDGFIVAYDGLVVEV